MAKHEMQQGAQISLSSSFPSPPRPSPEAKSSGNGVFCRRELRPSWFNLIRCDKVKRTLIQQAST